MKKNVSATTGVGTLAVVNGRLVPRSEAYFTASDLAVLRGYSVFDYTRSYGMVPFMLREHAARLRSSAKRIGIVCPYSVTELVAMATNLIQKEGTQDRGIRMILSGGDAQGLSPAPNSQPRLVIVTELITPNNPAWREEGGYLMAQSIRRDIPAAKTTGYVHAVRLDRERKRQKACDILYIVDGAVRECSIANFFIIKKGKVITATADILPGITRTVVLRLARKLFGTKNVIERDVFAEELAVADEAFVTATNKEVVPVVRVGAQTIGIGLPGEMTLRLRDAYEDFVRKYIARYERGNQGKKAGVRRL